MDFCSNSRYRIWCDFRSSFACIQNDCHTGSTGTRLSFCLMTYLGVDIATGSLFAGLVIGFGSLWLGKKVYCPMTVLYIPALLPMIPGKFAYNMVFSLIMCLQNVNDPDKLDKFMSMFFSNTLIASTVIFMLAVGATFPMFLFPHRAFSLTRH